MKIAGPRVSKVNLNLAAEINRGVVRAMPAGIGAAVADSSKSDLESRLIVAAGEKIYAVSGNKKKVIAERDNAVWTLAIHEGQLYDGGENQEQTGLIYNTLDSPHGYLPMSGRPGAVNFLVSFRGILHDGGNYDNVYDSLNDKEGKNPILPLFGPCYDALVYPHELLIAVKNNARHLPPYYDVVVADVLCSHKGEDYCFNAGDNRLNKLWEEELGKELPFYSCTLASNGSTILAGAEIEASDEASESNGVDEGDEADERRVVYAVVDALSEKFDRICEFDDQVNKILIPTPEVWQKIIEKYGEPK